MTKKDGFGSLKVPCKKQGKKNFLRGDVMKLWQKIEADVKSAKEKGYQVAVSYGAYTTFCKLKNLKTEDFDKNLKAFNEYLQKHGLAVVRTRKGLRYTYLKSLKEFKKKEKKEEEKITL